MGRLTDGSVNRAQAKVQFEEAKADVRLAEAAFVEADNPVDKAKANLARIKARKQQQDAGKVLRPNRKSRKGKGKSALQALGIVK